MVFSTQDLRINSTDVDVFSLAHDYRASLVVIIAIIASTVAISGSSRRQRKGRKEPVCYDCKTQSQYTFTLTLDWDRPRVVPINTWKLFWNQAEIHRFVRGADPFYSRPVAVGGGFEAREVKKAKSRQGENTSIPTNSENASGVPAVDEEELPSEEVIEDVSTNRFYLIWRHYQCKQSMRC